MPVKKILIYMSIVCNLILFLLLTYFIVKPNDDNNIDSYAAFNKPPLKDTFPFNNYLGSVPHDSVKIIFPYKDYIHSGRYKDLHAVKNDLAYLDSKYPQNIPSLVNIETMLYVLTDSLFNKIGNKYEVFSGDEYYRLFQWAESFQYISLYEPQKKKLYSNISDYWFQFIVKKMSEFSYTSPEIKYDFKYRFLQGKLKEKSYYFSTKVTSKEKVVYNLANNDWAHLYQASWNQSSKLQKLVFFLFVLFTAFSYILTLVTVFNKINKKKL